MAVDTKQAIIPPASHGGLAKFVAYLSKIVDPLIRGGAAVAAVVLAVMMFFTFADVSSTQIGKYLHISFFKPIIGSQEITELLMLTMVVFAIGYNALFKGHIRVDLIMQYTSRKVNQWFDVFTYFFSFVFYVLIGWQGWLYAWSNIHDETVSTILNLPIYPFNFLLVIGAAFAALIFLRDCLHSFEEVTR
jgi:TRAP-type C4-dicarboxylate transport system permease small subunit